MKGAGADVFSRHIERLVFNGSSSLFNSSTQSPEESYMASGRPHPAYRAIEVSIIILVTSSISLLTVLGNVLVLLSIKVNRNLRTINNYFLFSLACADLIVGVFSINLYTMYIVKGYWPLGPEMCNFWLVVDYVVSNASVMNLMVICFDRYFCVTRPLSYPVRRTAGWAGVMIAAAWLLSLLLWVPAILLWQVGWDGRKVPEGQCYILLLANPAVTLATTIPAFYIPVVIMTVLYTRISLASQRRIHKPKPESANLFKPSNCSGREVACDTTSSNIVDDIVNMDETCSFKDDLGDTIKQQVCSLPSVESSIKDNSENSSPDVSMDGHRLDTETSNLKTKDSTEINSTTQPQPTRNVFKKHTSSHFQRPTSKIVQDTSKLGRRKVLREKRVTKTILAVLLAFVITWMPHNVMVLIGTFCRQCVPEILWTMGYFLCYINSMVNPVCYALCNATFKRTFKHLLMCHFKNLGSK